MNPTTKLKHENRGQKHVISLTKVSQDSGKPDLPFNNEIKSIESN